jgi:hypothetical protein
VCRAGGRGGGGSTLPWDHSLVVFGIMQFFSCTQARKHTHTHAQTLISLIYTYTCRHPRTQTRARARTHTHTCNSRDIPGHAAALRKKGCCRSSSLFGRVAGFFRKHAWKRRGGGGREHPGKAPKHTTPRRHRQTRACARSRRRGIAYSYSKLY